MYFNNKIVKEEYMPEKMETMFEFPIITDYSLSIEELLQNAGLNLVARGIDSENFPSPGTWRKKSVVEIVCFRRTMLPEEVIEEIGRQNHRHVDLHTLLAFEAHYVSRKQPCENLPIDCTIIALRAMLQNGGRCSYVKLRISSERNTLSLFNGSLNGVKLICPPNFLYPVERIAP
jgi:hypothetical protein